MKIKRLLILGLSAGGLLGLGCIFRSQGPTSVPAAAETLVRLAKLELAQRLDVGVETIGFDSWEAVDWPNASLGCHQPGMFYAQVITPGYRIILSHQGKPYTYHTDQTSRVVYCQESS